MPKTIPHIIHQIWLGPLEPPEHAMESWKKLHPTWEYHLWTEKNLPNLKNQQAFDASDNFPQKSDILRYELLYEYGGIFVDADEYCLKPIDRLLEGFADDIEVFAAYEGRKGDSSLVANGIMGCIKGSDFIQRLVDGINVDQPGAAWEIVGPKYLTEMLNKHQPKSHIIPSKAFFPVHHRQKSKRKISVLEYQDDPDVYGIQLWGSTNFAYKPHFLRNPISFLRYWSRRLRGKMFIVTDLE